MFRYIIFLSITLGCCFLTQQAALKATGGRTAKSESNYFSSLARIQNGASGSPHVVFLGSSITGRLPDRTQGFQGAANMGSDGGSAIDALRAMDLGALPIAPIVVIEANTLHLAFDSRESEISRALHSWWFRVGRQLPALSATARPSAFLYSILLNQRIGATDKLDEDKVLLTTSPIIPAPSLGTLEDTDADRVLYGLTQTLGRLRQRGCSFWIVKFPSGPEIGPPKYRNAGLALAAKARIFYWDLAAGMPVSSIVLTDGVHMSPTSATLVTSKLLAELDNHRSL